MSREETILNDLIAQHPSYTMDEAQRSVAIYAMKQWGDIKAREMSIAFGVWIAENEYITTTLPHEDVQLWQYNHYDRETDKLTEGEELTTDQLYTKYLETLNKKA